jgi:hypothetical protein
MVDALEMTEEAFDPSDAAGEEDTDAVAMPDLFQLARRVLCRPGDGTLRLGFTLAMHSITAWACAAAMAMATILPFGWVMLGADIPDGVPVGADEALSLIGNVGMMVMQWTLSRFLGHLHAAIRPGGCLDTMGAGKQLVSRKVVVNLRRWAVLLCFAAVPVMAFGLVFVFFSCLVVASWVFGGCGPGTTDENVIGLPGAWARRAEGTCPLRTGDGSPMTLADNILGFGFALSLVLTLCVSWPCLVMWYFSMKVATRLAMDDVIEVQPAWAVESFARRLVSFNWSFLHKNSKRLLNDFTARGSRGREAHAAGGAGRRRGLVCVRFGRAVALYHRSSTSYHIH